MEYYTWPIVTGVITVIVFMFFLFFFLTDTDRVRVRGLKSTYLLPNITLLIVTFAWAAITVILILNINAQLAL